MKLPPEVQPHADAIIRLCGLHTFSVQSLEIHFAKDGVAEVANPTLRYERPNARLKPLDTAKK